MSRHGSPALRPLRQLRSGGYTVVRRLGDYLPILETLLALLSGDAEGVSYGGRMILRRQVNRTIGGAFGKFAYGGRGGFGALLRKLLGL